MGLFDAFKTQFTAQPGAVFQGKQRLAPGVEPAMAPESLAFMPQDVGEMRRPPIFGEESFGDRLKKPNADGATFADRALMALMTMNGQGGAALQMRQGFKDQTRQDNERRTRNEALRGAYGEDGKFDMRKYMDAVGENGDALEAVDIQRALAPKTAVDGGFFYSVGPDGQGTWGEQRDPSYAEELDYQRQNDPEREALLEAQTRAYDALAGQRQNQGAYYGARARQPYAPQRARAGPAGGGRGAAPPNMPPPPPGFRPVSR
jgi:hypothetical protein